MSELIKKYLQAQLSNNPLYRMLQDFLTSVLGSTKKYSCQHKDTVGKTKGLSRHHLWEYSKFNLEVQAKILIYIPLKIFLFLRMILISKNDPDHLPMTALYQDNKTRKTNEKHIFNILPSLALIELICSPVILNSPVFI